MRPERQTRPEKQTERTGSVRIHVEVKSIEKAAAVQVRLVREWGFRRGFRPPTAKRALPFQTRPQAELPANGEKGPKNNRLYYPVF